MRKRRSTLQASRRPGLTDLARRDAVRLIEQNFRPAAKPDVAQRQHGMSDRRERQLRELKQRERVAGPLAAIAIMRFGS
jgi:hypothetical protein